MHSEEEKSAQSTQSPDADDGSQESMLDWLMELDRDEPEEKLFVVDRNDPLSQELTAFETEVAARPMTRGNATADDLATYVAEEIVISSDNISSDIYTTDDELAVEAHQDIMDEAMALDFSQSGPATSANENVQVADGDDILGLSLDDDIGDNYLVVKRVKATDAEQQQQEEIPTQPASIEQLAPGGEPPADLVVAAQSDEIIISESPEFTVSDSGLPEIEAQESELDSKATYSKPDVFEVEAAVPVLSVVDNTVFDDDLLASDVFDELAPEGWSPESEDIDALFDSLVVEEDVAHEAAFAIELQEAEVLLPVEPPVDEIEDMFAVFDQDIFAGESGVEAQSTEETSAEDIDALFDELGEAAATGDDICGLDAQEVVESIVHEEAAAETTHGLQDIEVAAAATADDLSWCIPQGIKFSYSSPSSGEIFAEFLDAFLDEGSSELEKLEDAVSIWEAEPQSPAAYSTVTRVLHTIKGIAKGVGLHYYGALIHNFETLLESMPRPQADDEQLYFRIVNAWLDAAVRGIEHVRDQRVDINSEFPQLSPARVEPVIDAVPAEPEQPAEAVAKSEPEPTAPPVESAADAKRRRQLDKKLADEGAKALAAQQSVRITSEKLDLLLNLTNQAQQLGVRTAQSAVRNKRASAELQGRLSSVRAHIADIADGALFNVTARGGATHSAELDALEMDRYSELQEAANILREGVEDLADLIEIASRHNSQSEALLKQQATVISSIGSSIRAARVVPASRLMPGLRRLVRTVSNDLSKDVQFKVAGEVGTLDRDDYARCQTILEHMVRNALDHGIETASERKKAGKAATGKITVDVKMAGADSVIVLRDDGRGIDPQVMRDSALRKGLDVDVESLSDEEAMNLIFHKGFSTAQTLSQISGRGVGMDIVLSELQQMGGDIRIESELGCGTAFHIRIPSNVAVNGALLVTTGDNSYAVPLGGVIVVDYLPVADFFAAVEQDTTLTVSGMECEPAYLGTLCNGDSLPDRKLWRSSVPIIVAGTEERRMAIAIDDVEEALELVIRSLGVQFASVPGLAGAATTADGDAVVALDLNMLVASLGNRKGTTLAIKSESEERLLALVVDDSRTQRMVATSQLESAGAETVTAENGAVAIDLLNTAERLPDVILLDVEMPVQDGIQTLREIRKSARFKHIPVIMVTSRTGSKHRTMAEQAGCNGYMGKPFNFPMLLGQINDLTGHKLEIS